MRRRIRRAAALAAVVFVASGQVGASLRERGMRRRRQEEAAAARRHSSLRLSAALFSISRLLLSRPERALGQMERREAPSRRPRTSNEKEDEEIRARPNVLFCCSVTFWLNIFSSLALSLFLHFTGVARLLRARRGVCERPLLDRRGEQDGRHTIKEREKESRVSAAIELHSLTLCSFDLNNEQKKTNTQKVPRLRGPRGCLPGALPGRPGL